MTKPVLIGIALAIVGAGAAFFIISSSDNPNTPDNLSQTHIRR